MKCLRIIPISDVGVVKLKFYVDECNSQSASARLKRWKAKQITKVIYRGLAEPKMLREEWDDKLNILAFIIEVGYEQYANELLENCKINFLKIVNDNGENFNMELIA